MTFETSSLSYQLSELRTLVQTARLTAQEIETRRRVIYHAILTEAKCLQRTGNFIALDPQTLRALYEMYDNAFFEKKVDRLFNKENTLKFRLSPRMTSAAGKTFQRRSRHQQTWAAKYEIAISTTLLQGTFNEDPRPITVSGVSCVDRLEALQRIMEHEILHLIEMLIWDHSSCGAERFRSMAERLFGHSQNTHQLITPREMAQTKYGIQAGQRVKFTFDGRRYVGMVNRVTKRATVLVPDRDGQRYSDGQRYLKFYVPLPDLQLLDESEIQREPDAK